jgi:polysaccharide export outer membrane protein
MGITGQNVMGWAGTARLVALGCVLSLTAGCDATPKQPIQHLSSGDVGRPIPVEISEGVPPRDPLLGQGDEIEIQVYLQDGLTRTITIPPSEVIAYPLVGEINVHGMSNRDLRLKITEGLAPFVKDPQVTIRTVTARNQSYLVLGEVHTPGEFASPAATTALQAVVRAGGFTKDARQQVVLIRPKGKEAEAYLLDLNRALKEGDLRGNVTLAAGDILYVPPSMAANIDRFADHFSRWLGPVLGTESAVILGDEITHRLETGGSANNSGVVIGTNGQ